MKLLFRGKSGWFLCLACVALCAAVVAGASLAAPSRLPTDPPTLYVTIPVRRIGLMDAVAAGDVSMSLVGDNRSVTHVQLHLFNETQKLLEVSVPAGQVFVPEDLSYQYMMVMQPVNDVITPESN